MPSNMPRISGERSGIGAVGERPPGHKRIQKHSCDSNGQLFGRQDSVKSSIHRHVLLHTPRVHRLHHLAKKSCKLQERQEIHHNRTQPWHAHPIAAQDRTCVSDSVGHRCMQGNMCMQGPTHIGMPMLTNPSFGSIGRSRRTLHRKDAWKRQGQK